MRYRYLVVHCTATEDLREVTSDEIRHWHTDPKPKGRGWKQVGYSDMIHLDGRVENLVPYNEDDNVDSWEITNGVAGYNSISRHIVYVGGLRDKKPFNTLNTHQKYSLAMYISKFKKDHPEAKVVGHCDLAPKDCPCFSVKEFMESYGI